MSSRPPLYDSPLLLGFEQTRLLLERAAKAAGEGYPPYNVEEVAADRLRITLAVAGFSPDQLEVSLEDRQLHVSGRREPDGREGAYLHRGIAARGFQRTFILAEGMEVADASLEHGLLHLDLVRPEPSRLSRAIPIRLVR